MLKLIASALLFFFISVSAQTQLKWLNPQPSGYIDNKVVFSSATNGFIFNNGGQLITTQNQGASWEVARTFSGMTCFDLKDSTGIIAGYSGILYISNNNGITWQKKTTGINVSFILADIVSRDTIFIASSSKVYKSVNRGQTWQVLNTPSNAQIQSIDFVNSNLGFIGKTSSSILKTIDGGQTWQETAVVNITPSNIRTIKFLNTNTGYAFREHSTLLKTTNSGTTWTSSNMYDKINAISFPNDTLGYLVGGDGVIYRTTNAGATWTFVGPIPARIYGMDLLSLYFISVDTGFAVGHRGRILKTVNGGANWQSYSLNYYDYSAFAFPEAGTGYALSGTNIYKTTDTAKTWSQIPPASATSFKEAHFYSRDTGFLVAEGAIRIHKTNNGGQTWNIIDPSPNLYGYDRMTDLCPINDSTVFMSVYSSPTSGPYAIFKSKNKGNTWRKIDSSHYQGENFLHIYFLNEKTGYHSRYSQLYKTNDSAKTWSLIQDNNSYQIQAIWFIDARTGFVADDNGLKRTSDSGRTWTALPINYISYNDRDIKALKFLNSKVGYFTSAYGGIYQTIDSGKTWMPYSRTPYDSRYITFTKDSLVYFGSANGTIVSSIVDSAFGSKAGCINGPFSFSANVSGSTYQWQVNTGSGMYTTIIDNAFYSGTSTPVLNIINTPASWVGYQYRCLVEGSSYSQVQSLQFKTQWTGAIDSEWEKPGNWSCGMLPDSNTDVVITSGSVVLSSNTTVRSLKVSPGVSVIVNTSNTLTVIH